MFQGFATASGSKFHISEESMKKAEKVLSEENISESKNFTEAKFVGFSTAKGTKFNLSEESLKKGQDIFNDEFHDKTADNFAVPKPKKLHNAKFDGFSTAKGTKFNISEDSLKKAQNIFNEEFHPKSTDKLVWEDKNPSNSKDFPNLKFEGFSTARGKKSNVSEESLNKAKDIFSDELHLKNIEEKENFSEGNPSELVNLQKSKFDGFSTAKGTKFNISEDSLKKAKNIFDEEFHPKSAESVLESNSSELRNVSKVKFGGFSTAKGSKFNISEDSLKRARHIFDEEFNPKSEENHLEGNSLELKNLANVKFGGFSTAKGTKFNISEDLLKKAKNIFSEEFHPGNAVKEEENLPTETLSGFRNLPNVKFDGFSTAKGTKFSISEDSMRKAKNIFNEEIDPKSVENFDESKKVLSSVNASELKNLSNAKFDGFSTAKGTKFKVSEESLKNAKNIFNKEFHNKDNEKPVEENIADDVKYSQESTE